MSRKTRVREIDRHKAIPHLSILTMSDIEEGIKLMQPRYYSGISAELLKGSAQYRDHFEYRKSARDITKKLIENMISQPK